MDLKGISTMDMWSGVSAKSVTVQNSNYDLWYALHFTMEYPVLMKFKSLDMPTQTMECSSYTKPDFPLAVGNPRSLLGQAGKH